MRRNLEERRGEGGRGWRILEPAQNTAEMGRTAERRSRGGDGARPAPGRSVWMAKGAVEFSNELLPLNGLQAQGKR
ncbi:hypothetical protein LBMAG56_45100 [Verrucomicrobiota bacterium]|nr:hypothetical protein LBMAG56_45100 [Verrucomicrobiota bacterium]